MCATTSGHGDVREQAMQFADSVFRFFTLPLRNGSTLGFLSVCIGVSHQDRCQRPLALLSVGH
jgi:hypothetical protein